MVVVAHPDDEILGCGATMHKLIHEKDCLLHVVILGEGITSRFSADENQEASIQLGTHKLNIEAAQKTIGYQSLKTYDFPDNRFDTVGILDIVKVIEEEKNNFHPEIIFTHHSGDLNIDHQITFQAVMTAIRPLETEVVSSIITYETPSATEWQSPSDPRKFSPNFFIAVSESNMLAKFNGIEAYLLEKRPYPHPRSPEALENLATHYGIMLGGGMYEAFQVIRMIEKLEK